MLTKVTNSLYENILCLDFEMGSQLIKVFILRCRRTKRSGAEIVWFGDSSPRGDFRLKTTLHGWKL